MDKPFLAKEANVYLEINTVMIEKFSVWKQIIKVEKSSRDIFDA